MVHKEELIDEVDRADNVIATRPRSDLKKKAFFHNVSLVMLMTRSGKLLLARRANGKPPYPNTWSCGVGGAARSGESAEDAAKREMQEEIGKVYPIKKVSSFVYDKDYKVIFTVFTTAVPISSDELTLDPEEIQYCRAFTVEEIIRMIKINSEEFAPTFIAAMKEFLEYLAHTGI
jgi:isopentenyldiphosphate isomerase